MADILVRTFGRTLTVAALLAGALTPAAAHAQNPTTQQIEQALATRPGAGATVRSRISSSGLTPEQVRQRLTAAGYPANLLDAYMPGSAASAGDVAPDESVMKAASFLGLVDAQEAAAAKSGGSEVARVSAPAPAPEKPDSRIFGMDVFRRSTSQFQPDLAGPVDPSYKVGPRDVLALILTGGVETSYTLEVTREGFVVIPQVGQVYVANLTLDQVNDVLFPRLKQVYSGIGRDASAATKFYVTVAKLRTNQVFVIGEASAPASYQVSSVGTMLTALYGAGGPSGNGSMRKIELRRGGKVVSTLDVYDYLIKGDASRDVRLETSDVVFVPVHGPRVQISGEVIRPAIYEINSRETLRDVIAMAGGFTAEAGRRRVLVRRIVPPSERTTADASRDRTVLDLASADFNTGSGPTFPLQDGDQVEVLAISDRVRNQINVQGAVWSPGTQGFTAGMRLSDALRKAGGVKPDVKDVLITRLQSDQIHFQMRAAFSDTLGTLVEDMPLQEDDQIQVFGTTDFRPSRYVVITGAVKNGGRYGWHEGMTLHDIVQLAGGLVDGAYLDHAEVARLPRSRENGQLATTVNAPLDSTYLFERGIDGKYVGPPGLPAPQATATEFALQPYDNVLILRQPDWEAQRTVTLSGEVKFPGTYALLSKQERLSNVVQRAGGLTSRAYAEGALFTRTRGDLGRVAFNLSAAIREPGSRDDFVLVAGDELRIPTFDPTVRIEGAVHSPIAVAYVPGKKLGYYVNAAGGTTYNADRHKAYVRQPSGIVEPYIWRLFPLPDHKPKPAAGAVVVVPAKDPNDKKDWTAISGAVAQIFTSFVAIFAIMKRI